MTANLFSLEGKTAIVTGALGLLGRHHCHALAEAGASVVVADLDAHQARSFAAELEEKYGRGVLGTATDITDPASVEALKAETLKRFDSIDVLVNNAAVDDVFVSSGREAVRLENYPLELWRRSLDVNVTGTFLCSQILGAEMALRGQGSIINIASTYGVVAPDQSIYEKPNGSQTFFKSPAYPTTKGAVISLTRYLAAYWGRSGVRVNSLSPGGVENSQDHYFIRNYSARTPLGRMAKPTDYKGAIVFLSSDASLYMTGANLIVDGGWTAW
jgi:NAD(P)-dependent dehydrogenase (short-subunit alcohol dehydrogenase family)